MDILFATRALQKDCSSEERTRRRWGTECGKKIMQRLDDFRAANNLEIIRSLPAARCHELHGNRKGQLSVDVKHPYRLIFEPANEPLPTKPDGGLNWEGVP